jgi:hypothetical protein
MLIRSKADQIVQLMSPRSNPTRCLQVFYGLERHVPVVRTVLLQMQLATWFSADPCSEQLGQSGHETRDWIRGFMSEYGCAILDRIARVGEGFEHY